MPLLRSFATRHCSLPTPTARVTITDGIEKEFHSFAAMANFSAVYLFLSLVNTVLFQISEGGSCWRSAKKNGACGQFLRRGVTFQQCCNGKHMIVQRSQLAFSERDAEGSKGLFFLVFVNRPRLCKPCPNPCSGIICGVNSRASCVLTKTRQARCVCIPDCKETFQGKVCSTDQRTYSSECALLTEGCQTKKKIEIDYYSKCQDSCSSVVCPPGKFCVEDQYKLPHCVSNSICTTKCPIKENDEVLCGTNGVTYRNVCFLRQVVCRKGTGRRVGIAYKGVCKSKATCGNIICSNRNKCLKDGVNVRCVKCDGFCIGDGFNAYRPICGSDSQTYKNWCSLRSAACKSGKHIEVMKSGRCQEAFD